MKVLRHSSFLFLLAAPALLTLGCSGPADHSEPPPPEDTTVTPSPMPVTAQALAKEHWRRQMSNAPPAREGCFQVTHPSLQWVEVPCATGGASTPPPHPTRGAHAEMAPEAPGNALPGALGGMSHMTSITLPGTMSSAEGSFPIVTGLINENTNGTANSFSLQLNTNSDLSSSAITTLCKSTATPTSCTGWVQFVYWQGQAQIWYNLIGSGGKCPTSPSPWLKDSAGNCYYEATNVAPLSSQSISNLANMTLTGVAGGGTDAVTVATGPDTLYTVSNTSVFSLASAGWKYADFNVVGDGSNNKAVFNANTLLTVKVITNPTSGSTAAPTCGLYDSTTAESNNLTPVSCSTFGGSAPGVQFTETNAVPSCTGFTRNSSGLEATCVTGIGMACSVDVQTYAGGAWHTIGSRAPLGTSGVVDILANDSLYSSNTFRECNDFNGNLLCNDPHVVSTCIPKTCDTIFTCGPVPDGCGGTTICNCGTGQTCQSGQCVSTSGGGGGGGGGGGDGDGTCYHRGGRVICI